MDFSINKNLVENLHEESLIAQQTVVDHMHANQLKSHTNTKERSLIKKVKGSYQQYTQFLAKKHKEIAGKQNEDCLKPIIEDISDISCISKTRIKFLYQEKTKTRRNGKQKINPIILNIVLFYTHKFDEKDWIVFIVI